MQLGGIREDAILKEIQLFGDREYGTMYFDCWNLLSQIPGQNIVLRVHWFEFLSFLV